MEILKYEELSPYAKKIKRFIKKESGVKLSNQEKFEILNILRKIKNEAYGKTIIALNREYSKEEILHNKPFDEIIQQVTKITEKIFKN